MSAGDLSAARKGDDALIESLDRSRYEGKMTNEQPGYAYDNALAEQGEQLRTLEAPFDAGTIAELEVPGVGPGRHCLEVGAGAAPSPCGRPTAALRCGAWSACSSREVGSLPRTST
jgi:hypothetical protein